MATHSIFLPGEPHGQSSVVGYSPRGCRESDMIGEIKHIIKMKVPSMKMLSRYSSLLKFTQTCFLEQQIPFPSTTPHPMSSRDANCGMEFTGQRNHPEKYSDFEIYNMCCITSLVMKKGLIVARYLLLR